MKVNKIKYKNFDNKILRKLYLEENLSCKRISIQLNSDVETIKNKLIELGIYQNINSDKFKNHLKTIGFKKGHKPKDISAGAFKKGYDPRRVTITKEFRKSLILPVKDSSIELKIQNFLKELKIDFFTHQYMKIEHGYQCDIFIPSMNLVIECDGDYWHKYPIGNEIDHIRTSELIKNGFKVLRLWENEIRIMDLDKFSKLIKK